VKTAKVPEKRPPGRPRDPRQQKVQIRVNEQELEIWRAAAAAQFIELGTWVRSVVSQHLAAPPSKKGRR
jgi:hypothetical protein